MFSNRTPSGPTTRTGRVEAGSSLQDPPEMSRDSVRTNSNDLVPPLRTSKCGRRSAGDRRRGLGSDIVSGAQPASGPIRDLLRHEVHAGAQFLDVGVVSKRRVHANACVQADGAVSVLGIDGQDGSVDVSFPQDGERVVEEGSADSSPSSCRDDAQLIDQSALRVAGRFRVANAEGDDSPIFDGKEPQRRVEVVFAHPVAPLLQFRLERLIEVSEVVGERFPIGDDEFLIVFSRDHGTDCDAHREGWCLLRLRRTSSVKLVCMRWKRAFPENGPAVFGKDKTLATYEKRIKEMERLLGR